MVDSVFMDRRDLGKWKAWLRAANNRPATIEQRLYHVQRMLRETNGDPRTISTDELVAWLSSKEWRPNTMRSYRASLVAFFAWAQADGLRQDNPARKVPPVRMPRGLPRPTPEQMYREAALAAEPRVRLMIHLAAMCGLRRGEIARLKYEDVVEDLLGWSLRIQGKGGHVRYVPLPRELAIELRRERSGWVFPSSARPGPLTPAHVGKLVARALPDNWTCHTLRHRCGTVAYAKSKDLRAVQELLGHARTDTTALYTKIPASSIRQAMEAAAA